jgi:hypothetical protein
VKTRIEHHAVATGIAWLCCALTAIAHPVSHTDAWVKVSGVIDVRLNIFLDDVLRHQELLSADQTTVPRSQAVAAVTQHAQTLLKQLLIYDADGRRLAGRVVSAPDWQPVSDVVDLTVDSSLKISWTLQFEPAASQDGGFRRLCFVHTFSHPDLTQPGELRLHLQHKPSNRRIDAIVAPETPHTVILTARSSGTEPSDSTDINIAASRIVVAPNEVIHELTAPLLRLDVAWPQAVDFRGKLVAGISAGGSFDPTELLDARQRIAAWLLSNCNLHLNGEAAVQAEMSVEFFRGAADSSAAVAAALSAGETTPITDTQVGVRMRFPYARRVESAELLFAESPGNFDQLTVDIVTAVQRQTQIVHFNGEAMDSASGLRFRWDRNLNVPPAPDSEAFRIPTVAMKSPVRVTHRRPGRLGVLSLLLCTTTGFCMWLVRSAKSSQPIFSRGSLAALLLGVLLVFVVPDTVRQVDNERAGRLFERLLSNVHRAIADGGTEVLAESLSTTVGDDLAEQIYLSTMQCLGDDQANGVLINFSKTDVLSMEADEQRSKPGELYANCTWLVHGSVYHWGHIHQRQMKFSGEIVLSRDNDTWKIAALSPTEFSSLKSEVQSNGDL